MHERRWLRIISVALIMYTISYVDRTNISLALDPNISTMMKDLFMDDRMKGQVGGIFFFGYMLLQIPGGYWARRWSARKVISVFLVCWGAAAVGCGLARTFRQFEVMRFLLGVAESGVLPATLVLLSNWFPRAERARANAYWILCQPLALVASAPVTGKLLEVYGWQRMMVINSRHSDKTQERRGHVAVVYFVSRITLILSVSLKDQFWLSYGLMCLAIQGPFAGQAPFWAIPSETLPRSVMGSVMGLVNAFGNLG